MLGSRKTKGLAVLYIIHNGNDIIIESPQFIVPGGQGLSMQRAWHGACTLIED